MPNELRKVKVGAQVFDGATVIKTYDKPGSFVLGLPGGDDLDIVVEADAPVPIPPIQAPDPFPGQKIEYVKSGTKTLYPKSNTRYVCEGRARISADTGIWFNDGVENVSFTGFDFIGNGVKGDGAYGVARGLKNITLADCLFQNFKSGCTFHHPKIGQTLPRSEWAKNITLIGCRRLDMAGKELKEGHGGYWAHIDGLTITSGLVDGAGWAKAKRLEYTHGDYIWAGNKRVMVVNNIYSRCESVGVQARGSLESPSDADTGIDGGPIIGGNAFWDCAIAVMVNGPRASVMRNVGSFKHFHDNSKRTGWGMIYGSVGAMGLSDNIRTRGSDKYPGVLIDAFLNNKRDDEWARHDDCKTIDNGGNVDKIGKLVDLSDLVPGARAGQIIDALNKMQGRIRAA